MIGEVESKGGSTLEGSLLGETAQHSTVVLSHAMISASQYEIARC